MNLDDLDHMHAVDRSNMLAHIDALPQQLQDAWQLAQSLPLPETHRAPRRIVLCGMGGSAIGGDLTAALISRTSPVPFLVVRGYDLPAYVSGPDTLLILSSYSGGTEETLAAAQEALTRDVRILVISTGGKLAAYAQQHGFPLWQFSYQAQPRAALGWSFGLLIGLVHRLKLVSGLEADLQEALDLLREEQQRYGAQTPAALNPAKRGAGQLIGRLPVFFGAGVFEPVARRWKGQLNENAKVWSQYDTMPEANHNTVVGIAFPADKMLHLTAIFIASREFDHPRVQLRNELTYKMCLQNGIPADLFHPRGTSVLAQMLTAIQYGDYLSYYTAIAYDADPTTIAPIDQLKAEMAKQV